MLEFTGPEVAELSGVPYATLVKYTGQGVVGPSVVRGEGSGSVSRWDFTDLVAIASFGSLRPSSASLATLRALFHEWHKPEARALVAAAVAATAGRRAELPRTLVVVGEDGRVVMESETDLTVVCKKYGPRIFVVDGAGLVEKMLLESTMKRMIPTEPGKEKKKPRRAVRKKKRTTYPTLLLEASARYGKKPRRSAP